jgi:hypothetical protein
VIIWRTSASSSTTRICGATLMLTYLNTRGLLLPAADILVKRDRRPTDSRRDPKLKYRQRMPT